MATARIPVEWGVLPTLTARVEPATVEDANDLSASTVGLIQDGTVDDGFWWKLMVPSDYSNSVDPDIIAVIKTPAVSGNFKWLCNYRSIQSGETGDPATWQGTPSGPNTTVPGTARLYSEYTVALTKTDLVANDMLRGEWLRFLSSNGGADDTVSDVAIIEDLYFQYTLV